MIFSKQRLFAYDARLFQPQTLQDAFEAPGEVDSPDRFSMAGLQDLAMTYEIVAEWYRSNFAQIDIKELSRTVDGGVANVDDLYNEPISGKLTFSRKLRVHAYVEIGDPDIKHGKKGTEVEQPITCYFGVPVLNSVDYFPDIGDHVVYLGRLYEFTRVYVKTTDLFQNTGMPVHITAVATPFQFGDRKPPTKIQELPAKAQPQSESWV